MSALGQLAASDDDLDYWEAMVNACTPGPWTVVPETCGPTGQGVYETSENGPICEVGDPYPRGANKPGENMRFISFSISIVPLLIAALRDARAELEARS